MVGLRRSAVAIALLALLAAACFPSFSGLSGGDADEDAALPGRDGGGGGDGSGPESGAAEGGDAAPTGLPVSCQDAFDRGVRTNDGDVLIDPDGPGSLKPFTVYCMDITTTQPIEFLSLVNVTNPNDSNVVSSMTGSNISAWAVGSAGATTCTCSPNVVRAFTKVRLVLSGSTVKVLIMDHTFSSSNRPNDKPSGCDTGSCQSFDPKSMSYGAASCCSENAGTQNPLGKANVDLRGTPFHVAPGEVGHDEGYQSKHTTTFSTDRKTVDVTGGGSCGWGYASNNNSELALEQD